MDEKEEQEEQAKEEKEKENVEGKGGGRGERKEKEKKAPAKCPPVMTLIRWGGGLVETRTWFESGGSGEKVSAPTRRQLPTST